MAPMLDEDKPTETKPRDDTDKLKEPAVTIQKTNDGKLADPTPDAGATTAPRTLTDAIRDDKIVIELFKRLPQLAAQIDRLVENDMNYLAAVAINERISYRDVAHIRRLIQENQHLARR